VAIDIPIDIPRDIPSLPFPRDNVLDIAPKARELLNNQPIARIRTLVGDEAWLVTGYEYVKALYADERLGRSHPEPEKAPRISHFFLNGGPLLNFETEKAEHSRMRKLLSPAFSARRMRILEGRVQQLVDGLLDDMADHGPPVDLQEVFSTVLPAYVFCELLGMPVADGDVITRLARAMDNVTDADRSMQVFLDLAEYLKGLVARKRAEPGDDVISDLIAAEQEWDLTPDDLIRLVAALVISGYAAPGSFTTFGTLCLLLNPDQKELLLRDDSLVADAIEEFLRIIPMGSKYGQLRYAHADVPIGEVTIKAGEAVLLLNMAANRDPSVFADPDRLDITRRPNPHLAFGQGGRYCLGANLARLQLQVVFRSLFQRFPTLRLAEPVEKLELTTDQIAERLVRLPVTW
jgi:cytochrome P450